MYKTLSLCRYTKSGFFTDLTGVSAAETRYRIANNIEPTLNFYVADDNGKFHPEYAVLHLTPSFIYDVDLYLFDCADAAKLALHSAPDAINYALSRGYYGFHSIVADNNYSLRVALFNTPKTVRYLILCQESEKFYHG